MLVFPNSKINLGLNITEKRSDGYHNIETVFYPVNWSDALEVIETDEPNKKFEFYSSGKKIAGDIESNLIYKAYQLLLENNQLPAIKVHLHKNIPMGAGLGGGSADAAYFINLIDKQFNLNLNIHDKLKIANQLGSDCAFFIQNKAVYANERGTQFSDCKVDLSAYFILVIYPNIHSNTKEAYEGVIPKASSFTPKQIIENQTIENWKNVLTNDFENSIFKKYPAIKELKESLYSNNALYASLSGSGSAVFGIFKERPNVELYKNFEYFLQTPQQLHL